MTVILTRLKVKKENALFMIFNLLTGYATGDETLHEDMFQIRPGEFVIAEKKSSGKIELS